jgi:hypothetical protein
VPALNKSEPKWCVTRILSLHQAFEKLKNTDYLLKFPQIKKLAR